MEDQILFTLLNFEPQSIEGVLYVLGALGLIIGWKIVKATLKLVKKVMILGLYILGAVSALYVWAYSQGILVN